LLLCGTSSDHPGSDRGEADDGDRQGNGREHDPERIEGVVEDVKVNGREHGQADCKRRR
jgi:hypothetical protein